MRAPCLRTTILVTCGLAACSAFAVAHGIFEKPLWSDKANYSIRGSAPGTQATKLYMMQPRQYMTKAQESVGWRVVMQDVEAETQELVTMSVVRYAANGRDPDTGTNGTLFSASYRLFGFGLKGTVAFDFTLTIGFPRRLPTNYGLGVELPGNAKWPQDGASIHAQLNIPQDSRRPRVIAPHDKQVWAFDQPGAMGTAVPLGGRTLDQLNLTGLYTEPVMQLYARTSAYGLGTEEVLGAEAYHPVAARGDGIGVIADGGILGADGWALVMLSPSLARTPLPFPPGLARPSFFYLDIANGFPIPLLLSPLDSLGRVRTPPLRFADVPASFRTFWLQTLIMNPFSLEVEVTGAVQVQGQ